MIDSLENRTGVSLCRNAGAVVILAVLFFSTHSQAAVPTCSGLNYDEAEVGSYTLPDPLLGKDSFSITDVSGWVATRRGEILRDFRDLMYRYRRRRRCS